MGKSVILEIGKGCFETGFPVTLEAWLGGDRPDAKILGQLPPSPTLPQFYNNWQSAYLAFKAIRRIQKKQEAKENNYSDAEVKQTAVILKENLNSWLNSNEFREIRERLLKSLAKLDESDELLLILQTQDNLLRRLPWHLWDLLEDYSQKVEVALSPLKFERIVQAGKVKEKIRILAVFGDSTHINTKADKQVIENLCGGEIDSVFLPQPSKQELNEHLWDEQGWDILFFAGHSSSEANGKNGCIHLKPNEKITVSELEYALKTSIERGLQVAIFNSCDGLGIAWDFAALQIPHMIVMREPVADAVAQFFWKYFIEAFYNRKSLYTSVREARRKLQGHEDFSPCASWFPVICQNPAHSAPTWDTLLRIESEVVLNVRWEQLPKKAPLSQNEVSINEVLQPSPLVKDSELYEALKLLNYEQEDKLFGQFFGQHTWGCYLIQGVQYSGQGFLLNRLIEYAPRHKTSLEIPIDLARTSKANDLRAILDDIGLEVGAIKPYSPESVAQAIVESLNYRNVILVFKNAHNLPEDDLNALINFWSDTLARLYRNRSYNYRLLMFLVDGRGNLNLKRNFVSEFQENWMPDIPVILQIQNDFSQNVLTKWLNKISKILMPEAINLLRQDTQFILGSNQNDLPEFVIKKICLLCNCNWSLIQSWLRT